MKANPGPSILSVPSWVIPGTYAENLRFLDNRKEVEGVELLFFLYDNEVKAQLESEWDEICGYAKRFIFTAHLPEPLLPAHGELVARLAPLVRHFIIHPAAENPDAQASLLANWVEQYGTMFLAENTSPGLLEAFLPHLENLSPHIRRKTGICMDTGHLLLEGQNPADFFTRHRNSIAEIHLHGVDREQAAIDGRLADHRRLRGDEKWLLELLPLLGDYGGIVELEVFSWEEASASIGIFQAALCNNRRRVQR